MAGQEDDDTYRLGPFGLNKPALILVASLALGTGGITGFSNISEPVPDRYTGTEGDADRDASIARDRAEQADRTAEDNRLRERIQKVETRLEKFDVYQHKHEVEAAQGFSRINHLEKKVAELDSEIRAYRGR
jgi:hypothetical protein